MSQVRWIATKPGYQLPGETGTPLLVLCRAGWTRAGRGVTPRCFRTRDEAAKHGDAELL